MFERRSQISAISQEVARMLVHPGWKKYRDEWDRRSIDRYLDDRRDELDDNPFSRRSGRFNAREEAFRFLTKMLQGFVDAFANSPYSYKKHYVHAANALADILGVPVPPATPRNGHSGNWWMAYMPQQPAEQYAGWDGPPPARPSGGYFADVLPPPGMHYARTPSGTAFNQPQLPPPDSPWTNPMGQYRSQQLQLTHAAAEPSDDHRMAALQVLMTHPSTPEHERRAALEAYMRLLAKRNSQ